ncbi:hypothetical protein ABIB58_003276 [Brevundimonas sp. UYEF29]
MVAGYVEGHAIEIVLDPLKRPQQGSFAGEGEILR